MRDKIKYKILDNIARADIAYQVFGKTLEELFANAAEAVASTMVEVATVSPSQSLKFKVQSSKLEGLLLDFLNELVFLKDSKQLLFSQYKIKIYQFNALRLTLYANLWGEKIDPRKHHLKCDVKAITRHKFSLEKKKNQYSVIIVLDI